MTTIKQYLAAFQLRHSFGSNDRKRDKGQTTPDDILRFDNILLIELNIICELSYLYAFKGCL